MGIGAEGGSDFELAGDLGRKEEEVDDAMSTGVSCSSDREKSHLEDYVIDESHMAGESVLDSEVRKRLNQLVPVPVRMHLSSSYLLYVCRYICVFTSCLCSYFLLKAQVYLRHIIHLSLFVLIVAMDLRLTFYMVLTYCNFGQHVPKVNGDIPSADEEVSDHQRLLDRSTNYSISSS